MQTEKIPFLTAYSGRKELYTPAGKKLEPTYGYDINKKGQKVLVVNGEKDVYEIVQESLEETKIENVLARAMAGDSSVFRPTGIFADVSVAPSNLIEARRMMQNMENMWQSLPSEIKNKYNNDLEYFIGQSGSESWLTDMGIISQHVQEETQEKLKQEVITNES